MDFMWFLSYAVLACISGLFFHCIIGLFGCFGGLVFFFWWKIWLLIMYFPKIDPNYWLYIYKKIVLSNMVCLSGSGLRMVLIQKSWMFSFPGRLLLSNYLPLGAVPPTYLFLTHSQVLQAYILEQRVLTWILMASKQEKKQINPSLK